MNLITTKDNGKSFYSRPDTSLNRDCNNYFCLDQINELSIVFFEYIKIDKPAKSVKQKFADRYATTCGYGIQFIANDFLYPDKDFGFYTAASLDNTTFITQGKCIVENSCPPLTANIDNKSYSLEFDKAGSIAATYPQLIENVSSLMTLRTGDYLIKEIPSTNIVIKRKTENSSSNTTTTVSYGNISVDVVW